MLPDLVSSIRIGWRGVKATERVRVGRVEGGHGSHSQQDEKWPCEVFYSFSWQFGPATTSVLFSLSTPIFSPLPLVLFIYLPKCGSVTGVLLKPRIYIQDAILEMGRYLCRADAILYSVACFRFSLSLTSDVIHPFKFGQLITWHMR